ncbi:hypothetical protein GCM10010404_39280 [Nonomuraea africana]|uniref:Peroxiredoxin n=1 Tax=Nonomuraea africana TaxID=46171 RepID=A0ABR9KV77_9ACTN|nr:redoxin domain-containing protein [Nonomuraea africana]MBE1565934.1 peroxiredoxin [Nonomuraea africana]
MTRLFACLLVVVLALTACARTEPDLLAFRLPAVDGGTVDGASLRGRPAVLWFWAPWCTICRAEAPEVGRATRYQCEVAVIGVAGRGPVADMRQFVEQTGLRHLPHAVDTDGAVWATFGVTSQPAFAFLDRRGSAEVFTGSLPPDDLSSRMEALAR